MGSLRLARRIDDAVFGRPDTTRGFVSNLLLGLHPGLAAYVCNGMPGQLRR